MTELNERSRRTLNMLGLSVTSDGHFYLGTSFPPKGFVGIYDAKYEEERSTTKGH